MARVNKAELEKKQEVEVQDEVKKETETKKTRTKTKSRAQSFREKKVKIKKDAGNIEVEVLNISDTNAYYVSKQGLIYFDLAPSEDTLLTLDELDEIMRDGKGFFTDDILVITNVYSDDYDLTDIMGYLRLRDPNKVGYDYLEDFVINSTDDEFRRRLEREDRDFVKKIACKAIYLDSVEEYILPRSKETILCNLLGLQLLIGENER